MSETKERPSERAMRLSQKKKSLGITFEQWFEVLEKLVNHGNCLIDDIYGVHKINRVSLDRKDNPKGVIFHSDR